MKKLLKEDEKESHFFNEDELTLEDKKMIKNSHSRKVRRLNGDKDVSDERNYSSEIKRIEEDNHLDVDEEKKQKQLISYDENLDSDDDDDSDLDDYIELKEVEKDEQKKQEEEEKEKMKKMMDIFSESAIYLQEEDEDLMNDDDDNDDDDNDDINNDNNDLIDIDDDENEFLNDEEKQKLKTKKFLKNINYRNPEGTLFTLKPYQQYGLKWCLERETKGTSKNDQKKLNESFKSLEFIDGTKIYYCKEKKILTLNFIPAPPDPKGGILADEMGLGKTVQMIALICSNRPSKYSNIKTTLVLCPLSITDQWKREIETKTSPSLKVYVYQGGSRIRDSSKLANYDVIISTYQTVSNEYKNTLGLNRKRKKGSQNKNKPSPLFIIKYFRVILDEAHNIKNRKAKQTTACIELNAERRWCLTGTPIQNTIDDLFTLFSFLRVAPHGDWNWWNKNIGKPFQNQNKTAIKALRDIVSKLLLRRMKGKKQNNGNRILNIPKKIIKIKKIKFRKSEQLFYDMLFEYTKDTFQSYIKDSNDGSGQTVVTNWANILELLLHLRQSCDHPCLVANSYQHKKQKGAMKNFLNNFITKYPNLYLDIVPCLKRVVGYSSGGLTNTIGGRSNKNGGGTFNVLAAMQQNWKGSVKINKLIQDLYQIRKTEKKSVVFSQWTGMLDLIEIAFEKARIRFVRIDGSLTRKDRDLNIQQFKKDPHIEVILISLKAGGLGLNLVCATYVFLMDLWWNPFVEKQAIDRVHRFGQTDNVVVIRYIIQGSVEERMLNLQQSKDQMASKALGDDDLPKDQDSLLSKATNKESKEEQKRKKIKELAMIFADNSSGKDNSNDKNNTMDEDDDYEEDDDYDDDDDDEDDDDDVYF